MQLTLVTYDCGCVGFAMHPQALIIQPCDGDRDRPSIDPFWRTMGDKPHKPLAEPQARILLDELAKLVQLGNRFKELKAILAVPVD